jgi:hypothetical protein
MKQFFLFLALLAAVFLTAQTQQQTSVCTSNTNTVYDGNNGTVSTTTSLEGMSKHAYPDFISHVTTGKHAYYFISFKRDLRIRKDFFPFYDNSFFYNTLI